MNATTKTTKDEHGEYRIRLFIDGKYQSGADYFTDDKEDAIETSKAIIKDCGYSDKSHPIAISEQADFDEEFGAAGDCIDAFEEFLIESSR